MTATAGVSDRGGCGTLWHGMARDHFSLRLDPETRRHLEREAERRQTPKTRLAEALLREALQLAAHPGIVFRDGPAGRRPGIAGGPDVWETIEVWLDEGRDSQLTARTLGLTTGQVEAALGYYAEYRPQVDDWIARNRALAEEAEASWRRRQSLGAG